MSYKPIIKRVPTGYQGLIGLYSQKNKFVDVIGNDDSIWIDEISALSHAKREIKRQMDLDYAVHFLRRNWDKLKSFEKEGYMGQDMTYNPHGIDRNIWKEAYSLFSR